MEKLKAIGCPPLRGAATGGQGGQRSRLEGIALLAAAFVLPALAGCPGHLDFFTLGDGGPTPGIVPDAGGLAPVPKADAAQPPSSALETTATPGLTPDTCAKGDEIFNKILMPVCAGCHGGAAPRAGLDLSMPGAKGRMIEVMAKGLMAPSCTGKSLVGPDGSGTFMDKISGTGCGPQMPFNKPPLNDLAIACLRVWLQPAPGQVNMKPPPATPSLDKTICATAPEVSKLLAGKCGGCHMGAAAPAGLDLASMGARMRLLNIASKSPKSGCAGKLLVVADGTGVFFDKINGTACGNQMPFTKPPLSNQELWCLKEWIKPGAGGTFPEPQTALPTMMPVAPPPGDGGVAPPPPASCATADEITNKILHPKCLPCHGKVMPALGLDLDSPGARGRILGVVSKEGGACGGKLLANVDGTGVLFDKVVGPVPTGCGNQMPFGTPPLSSAEVECLKAWLK